MNSLSHKKDFEWSLALAIFNNEEVREVNFTDDSVCILMVI